MWGRLLQLNAYQHCRPRTLRDLTLSRVPSSSWSVKKFSTEEPSDAEKKHGEDEDPTATSAKKRLDVAIVGLPNAGKSQLLNVLTQSTVSAVSRKRHTTREGILGARTIMDEKGNTNNGTQLIFVDTPGFLRYQQARPEGLDRKLQVEAREAMRGVDFSLIVVDAARTLSSTDYKDTLVSLMLSALEAEGRSEFIDVDEEEEDSVEEDDSQGEIAAAKFAIVLNKVDLVNPKPKLLEIAMEVASLAQGSLSFALTESQRKEGEVKAVVSNDEKDEAPPGLGEIDPKLLAKLMPPFFYTNARTGEGVEEVLQFLLSKATPSEEWPIPAGQSTNQTIADRIAEVIREKLYRVLHKELPYSITQETKVLKQGIDSQDGTTQHFLIHQDLIVYTKSHAELVRGKKNQNLNKIQETAERDLEKVFGSTVNLHLQVKLNNSKNDRGLHR